MISLFRIFLTLSLKFQTTFFRLGGDLGFKWVFKVSRSEVSQGAASQYEHVTVMTHLQQPAKPDTRTQCAVRCSLGMLRSRIASFNMSDLLSL